MHGNAAFQILTIHTVVNFEIWVRIEVYSKFLVWGLFIDAYTCNMVIVKCIST